MPSWLRYQAVLCVILANGLLLQAQSPKVENLPESKSGIPQYLPPVPAVPADPAKPSEKSPPSLLPSTVPPSAVPATAAPVVPFYPNAEGLLPVPVEAEPPPPVTYGPKALQDVGILQNALFGSDAKNVKTRIAAWTESDYTYRTSGSGRTTVAPMMNRFGNEFLFREVGLMIWRPLDQKELSWGYNVIYFGGSDASVINPTAGWYGNPNSHFSDMFTDLNVTAHLPILTEGGVDLKAGRQTTVLGPMGALGWQRTFGSADYGWYNLEEGRYTGASANWKINKRLSWYNGLELGWGTFFAQIGNNVDYITQLVYWLDPEAKRTKTWITLLTGPTSLNSSKVSTVVETGFSHNLTERWYTMWNFQMTYSNGPVNQVVPDGYLQRAYTIYNYTGYHLTEKLDLNTRFDVYYDVDGQKYPGGYGVPDTTYFEMTYGVNYHPNAWLEIRPEIRYDHASNPNFGVNHDTRDQLSLAINMLTKF